MDWTDRLRLRHLQIILSLAQTRNLSRSATALNTTQPGLSKWLKELEADIGLPLFERHARGLKPTPHGKALIAHAERIQSNFDSARGDMAAMRDGGAGRVVVGTSGASASDTVPAAVLTLLQAMPHATVELVEGTIDRLLEQLYAGVLDLAVGRSTPFDPKLGLMSEMLHVESIHFIARAGHPLFDQPVVTWDDLQLFNWVVWPKGTPIRDSFDEALRAAGQSIPLWAIQSNSVTVNLALIHDSDLIGVASSRAAMRYSNINALRIVPLSLSGFGTVSMYWRDDAPGRNVKAAMLDCLRRVVKAPALKDHSGM